jgi:precorrin-6A/cobalt-precorrin-6A reductase
MPPSRTKTLLILGGTREARELARRVTLERGRRVRVVTSLAGRREAPAEYAGEVRVGGFGGIPGMLQYLVDNHVDVVVDATHPFSAVISDHAASASLAAGIERLQLLRPMWPMPPRAQWLDVANAAEAAEVLPRFSRRAFLTVGAKELGAFSSLPTVWLVVRLMDRPKDALPLKNYEVVVSRPPFVLEDEKRLLKEHAIDTLVSKASGGGATEAKIVAAVEAGAKIVLIRRPPPEPGPVAETVEDCVAWLRNRL